MSDITSIAEEIRQAKQHLERALARARNRDTLDDWEKDAARWVNPPTYDLVDWPPKDPGYNTVELDERAKAAPRDWNTLEKVPVGLLVEDKDGDRWKIKADGRLRVKFKGEKKWETANEAGYRMSGWDMFAPFTEVKK